MDIRPPTGHIAGVPDQYFAKQSETKEREVKVQENSKPGIVKNGKMSTLYGSCDEDKNPLLVTQHHIILIYILSQNYGWIYNANYTSQKQSCGVCKGSFSGDFGFKSRCGHYFHGQCIFSHILVGSQLDEITCPECCVHIEMLNKKNEINVHHKFREQLKKKMVISLNAHVKNVI